MARHRFSSPTKRASLVLVLLAAGGVMGEALAQSNLRSTFPGRRMGGGTRGECTSRLVAHLVPASSVFAPGSQPLLGVLEGPTADPKPLLIEFRPAPGSAGKGAGQAAVSRRSLPPTPAGVTLLSLAPFQPPTVWQSSYQCAAAGTGGSEPLSFVDAKAPPAVSLLVADATPADAANQASLRKLRSACGTTVPRAEVASAFGLGDVIKADWPARIPVRCP